MSVPQVALPPAHFALLQRAIRTVARHHRLTPDDAEDFSQTVHLKLLERNYSVFDSYEGRSSLTTYLTVVVTRLLLDWRNATRGKWRPSASAVRLGPDAVALERLIHRDGLTAGEAVATLAHRDGEATASAGDRLARLAGRLPARARRTFVRDATDEVLGHADFRDPVVAAEARMRRFAVRRALLGACAKLTPEERRLLALRFGRSMTVRAIGDHLGTDPKPLYRRLDRVLATLRRSMTAMGVDDPTLEVHA